MTPKKTPLKGTGAVKRRSRKIKAWAVLLPSIGVLPRTCTCFQEKAEIEAANWRTGRAVPVLITELRSKTSKRGGK